MRNSLVGESEGKRPLGRRKGGWQSSIKAKFKEIGYGGVNLVLLAQDMMFYWWIFVNTVMNEPSGFHNKRGPFLPTGRLLGYEEGMCSMQLVC